MGRRNGNYSEDTREKGREFFQAQRLLDGSDSAATHVMALDKAAEALLGVGRAFQGIVDNLVMISSDTARALSDNVELKRYLKEIRAREQNARLELNALKERAASPRKQHKPDKSDKPKRGKRAKKGR